MDIVMSVLQNPRLGDGRSETEDSKECQQFIHVI